MAFGNNYIKVDLNGSGAGSATRGVYGILAGIRVVPSSGTPTVTIADTVDTVLSSVVVSTDTTYHPQAEVQDNSATTKGLYTPYVLVETVTVTVTGGAASGSVEVWLKIV